ncbi:hypothetical protein NDU88_009226 [Pleurodeles waltl]|uniref:Uncharacterized protein n=1 Tax=Pleurodeles waltl TaxID=8319 RepID=A0AAV7RVL4_PLEWA|nr:hypothetical protein NDU88_009226 [Pleurodeles waltl]
MLSGLCVPEWEKTTSDWAGSRGHLGPYTTAAPLTQMRSRMDTNRLEATLAPVVPGYPHFSSFPPFFYTPLTPNSSRYVLVTLHLRVGPIWGAEGVTGEGTQRILPKNTHRLRYVHNTLQ